MNIRQRLQILTAIDKLPEFVRKIKIYDDIHLTNKMFKEIKSFWQTGKWQEKFGSDFHRTKNNIGYVGMSISNAQKVIKNGLRPGSHITSNIHDAAYWAANAGKDDKYGGVVIQVNVIGQKLDPSEHDQHDNKNHAVTKKKVSATVIFYLPKNIAKKLSEL